MSAPLVMYFDFTDNNSVKKVGTVERIIGLSDVLFTVDGSSDLEKATTLRDCWAHEDIFGKLKNN